MKVSEATKNRRSVRAFKDRPLSKEAIDQLIEASIWAPSAGNLQSRKFFFVTDLEVRKQLAQAALGQSFVAQAPLVVVACADLNRISERYGQRGIELYAICDAACSVQNLMLQAHELGLGSVWVGAFDEAEVARILDLPRNLRPISIVPIGYPAESPSVPPRVSTEEAVEFV